MTEIQREEDPADDEQTGGAPLELNEGPTLDEALLQIAALDKKAAEAHDKMLRALAEAENTRRRADKDRQDMAKFAITSFARDLLSVSDNLRRALHAITPEQRASNEQLNTIYEGVAATERELMRAFESHKIKKIEPLNEKFDPNLHEVMFEIPSADREPGTVLQVVEPGYVIHERLLRPARVGVAKGTDAAEGSHVDTQA